MSGYQSTAIPPAAQQQMLQVGQVFQGTVQRGPGFEVPLPLPLGPITVGITFPGNYPQQAPIMYVLNDVAHPLIGDDLRILYPAPKDWQPGYSIVTILRTIHNHFKQSPPTVRQRQPAQPPLGQASLPSQSPQSSNVTNPHQSSLPADLTPKPSPAATSTHSIPQIDPQRILSQCPPEKLARLSTPAEMEDFVNSLPEVRQLTEERDQLLRANLKLAEDNLAMKPELDALALNHQEIGARLQSEKAELDAILRQAKECEDRMSKSAVLSELQARSKRLDSESSTTFADFKAGRVQLDDFLSRYVEQRTEKWRVELVARKLATVD